MFPSLQRVPFKLLHYCLIFKVQPLSRSVLFRSVRASLYIISAETHFVNSFFHLFFDFFTLSPNAQKASRNRKYFKQNGTNQDCQSLQTSTQRCAAAYFSSSGMVSWIALLELPQAGYTVSNRRSDSSKNTRTPALMPNGHTPPMA